MAEKLTYLQAAQEVMTKAEKPLTFTQIWNEITRQSIDKKLQNLGKTPSQTLAAILYGNIKKGEKSIFVIVSKQPNTFWLKSRIAELDNKKPEQLIQESSTQKPTKEKFTERDLHPLLVKFLYESEFNAYAKTIYHEKSTKSVSGKNKWDHPDIVAVSFPFGSYKNETLELLQNIDRPDYRLYSFELKIALNFSNLKECYFQAVSNSSWANEGYLVVYEEVDSEVLSVLRRLNASFGIGLIKLESDIASSQILIQAREPEALDVETIDVLVRNNSDFKDFINDINRKIKAHYKNIGEINLSFDKVLDDDELEKYLKEKHIK
ncbi:HrgA protein [Helicobacter sp. MIT 00-7814]|uniref:HTH domain-containing protein n=1 Tax=unclassified Helicobacter TaxID=2593540 RepID=UPI000E1F4EE5|nr:MULTISPECIES: HTH domain-containing protein [unclassified Helicobacter]RDU53664.1 HrgA protein [Helicobacter sp. MIT 00-7814]RDU54036.1 HrgA protein [Helicobacter sp. MIT 99-10781]